MNYYNPYFYLTPLNYTQPKIGILQKLFGNAGISIGNFLNGTQKVLNIANQTIPIVRQVKPIFNNTKTMFKVMNEFKRSEIPIKNTETTNNIIEDNLNINENTNQISSDDGPTFFI